MVLQKEQPPPPNPRHHTSVFSLVTAAQAWAGFRNIWNCSVWQLCGEHGSIPALTVCMGGGGAFHHNCSNPAILLWKGKKKNGTSIQSLFIWCHLVRGHFNDRSSNTTRSFMVAGVVGGGGRYTEEQSIPRLCIFHMR